MLLRLLTTVLSLLAGQAAAQAAFAHHIVGNTYGYTMSKWESDIRLAASKGIDAFVLNIAPPLEGTTSTQIKNAFEAASSAGGGFKLCMSFDYEGGGIPWTPQDITALLQEYGQHEYYYEHNNRPLVSTFEGPGNADMTHWRTIRDSLSFPIHFVPDWTSQGPGRNADLVDGYFSWNMWPEGANELTTAVDLEYKRLGKNSKTYMMGVSPWFFTDLPAYGKSWVWKGDDLWFRRWEQVREVKPEFVQIVSWNDFGESHYIGPIYEPGVGGGAEIAAYKHVFDPDKYPAPRVAKGEEKVVYWYRLHPAEAGKTDATGNNCPSSVNSFPYQDPVPISEMLHVFAIALLSAPASVSITIGDNEAHTFYGLKAGINFVSKPFNGQTGVVSVTASCGVSGSGEEIRAEPKDGVANFNAWVGCAGRCS